MKEEKRLLEEQRLLEMSSFEREYSAYGLIAGIDEAGRGPLAGPVVAACCILPENEFFYYLNDSKKVTPRRRDILFDEIQERAVAFGIGIADHNVIDEVNILNATYKAMQAAVKDMKKDPGMLLVDAVTIPEVLIPQVPIVHGDARSVSIAAASILAKVTRDRMMLEYDKLYPEYGFASHKGYGTKQHIEALKKYGPCPIHRETFIKNFVG